MFKRIHDTWETLRALWAMTSSFFVRYFLPLHSDDDPEEDDEESGSGTGLFRLDWGDDSDDETPRALPAPQSANEGFAVEESGEQARPSYPGSGWPEPPPGDPAAAALPKNAPEASDSR